MAKTESTNQKVTLAAEARTIIGKKVKQMRKQGILPGNIVGPDFKSTSVSVKAKDFADAYKVAHETSVVYITLGKDSVPTLIKQIQHHPVSHEILHVDFRKIDLKQKIETQVPILVVGTSEAVAQKGGVLITQNDHLTIEALPTDIPAHIEIDITSLKEIGDEITVSQLPSSSTYVIKEEAEMVVVSVTAHKEESIAPEITPAEAPEVITEKAAEGETAGEETAAPAKEEEKK